MKCAFVTGLSGQDGSYLAEHLLSLGYRVTGILRRVSVAENQDSRLKHLEGRIETVYGDVTDASSLRAALKRFMPDEVYNLAGMSHVRVSFDVPEFVVQVNGVGVLNMLEAVREIVPAARLYQASSSEMFGNSIDSDGCQRESTPMHPVSPYGCAKLLGYNLVRHYRRAHGMFACNGILFNHESPRRGSNFVTSKVVKRAVEISRGLADKLELGNLDSCRDWGHSKDYVKAMWMMLQKPQPGDYVIATGETRSVREMCDYVFGALGLDYRNHVEVNERHMRPEELKRLRGDRSRAWQTLGWRPTYTFEAMMDEIITHWEDVIDGAHRIERTPDAPGLPGGGLQPAAGHLPGRSVSAGGVDCDPGREVVRPALASGAQPADVLDAGNVDRRQRPDSRDLL